MNSVNRVPVYTLRSLLNIPQLLASSSNGMQQQHVNFSTTNVNRLKEIVRTENAGVTVIVGKHVPSPREGKVVNFANPSGDCPLCKLGLPIAHTDVLILRQFVRDDGCILPARVTGLCKMQQKKLTWLVAMAQKAGLMPNVNPINSNKDPKKRFGWKRFNKYYEESIIEDFMTKGHVKKA